MLGKLPQELILNIYKFIYNLQYKQCYVYLNKYHNNLLRKFLFFDIYNLKFYLDKEWLIIKSICDKDYYIILNIINDIETHFLYIIFQYALKYKDLILLKILNNEPRIENFILKLDTSYLDKQLYDIICPKIKSIKY